VGKCDCVKEKESPPRAKKKKRGRPPRSVKVPEKYKGSGKTTAGMKVHLKLGGAPLSSQTLPGRRQNGGNCVYAVIEGHFVLKTMKEWKNVQYWINTDSSYFKSLLIWHDA